MSHTLFCRARGFFLFFFTCPPIVGSFMAGRTLLAEAPRERGETQSMGRTSRDTATYFKGNSRMPNHVRGLTFVKSNYGGKA